MPRISPPATSPSPARKKPSAAHGLTHPRASFRAISHPFAPCTKKEEADENFTRRHLLFASSITASSASEEAGVEVAEAVAAFPSDAGAAEAVAASSNGGGDDGGVRSRRHPCVHRRALLRRMRLRQRPR